ncbi:hypothetical protein MLD38_040032 [Melastoma candidum]|uniref:Uncharacterized protein n=1 Tax=Melastoma candidum TaxID=119954 RepID=A0ACB9L584_9MYRT|nr:hypothetical protein MLD38_040032 [Melastoma candidum]
MNCRGGVCTSFVDAIRFNSRYKPTPIASSGSSLFGDVLLTHQRRDRAATDRSSRRGRTPRPVMEWQDCTWVKFLFSPFCCDLSPTTSVFPGPRSTALIMVCGVVFDPGLRWKWMCLLRSRTGCAPIANPSPAGFLSFLLSRWLFSQLP